jgi:tRNA(Ile)-lysidine synthase TilS/MesJ
MLFSTAQELGCNKIALGHHRDDLMQTALMNLTYEGRFSTMPPRMTMDKFPVEIIRPLCLMRESDLQLFAQQRNFVRPKRLCPYENDSRRADMKRMVERFEELNPEFAYTFFTALERTFTTESQK